MGNNKGRPAPLAASAGIIPYAALFFAIGFSALSFEVALTRLFAILLYHDFVFMAVSLAVLGVGLGAILSPYLAKPEKGFPHHLLLIFALSMPIDFFIITALPSARPFTLWMVFGAACLPPFVLMGVLAAYFYSVFPGKSGLLYAADLLGGALGTLASIPGMHFFGPFNYCLVLAALSALAAALAAGLKTRRGYAAAGLALLCLVSTQLPFVRKGLDTLVLARKVPGKPLFDIARELGVHIEKTRWNAVGRLDMISTVKDTFKCIYTDASIPATMYRFNGDIGAMGGLRHFIGFAPFTYGRNKRVLSIGCGAGLDCLLGKLGGADTIIAVEVNGAMTDMVRAEKDYNGGVLDLPGVRSVVDEGRSFVRASTGEYDLMLFLLTQGNMAEAGGRITLENYLVTQEAFREFYDRLAPGGKIAIATHNPHRASRMLMTWAEMLKEKGVDLSGAVRRAALLSYTDIAYRFLLILHRDLPSEADMRKLKDFTDSTQATAIYLPFIWEEDKDLGGMAQGKVTALDFINTSPQGINIWPVTDNKPFQNDVFTGVHPTLKFLAKAVVGALALVIVFSLLLLKEARPGRLFGWDLYFSFLGMGFMIAEIIFMRRLMLYLGYPALSLAVVLFSILVSSGLGGILAQRSMARGLFQKAFWPALALGLLLMAYFPVINGLMDSVMHRHIVLRCALASVLLFIPGILMGMPFPTGLARVSDQIRGAVPWTWAVNGVASVAGSVISMVVALLYGLQAALICAGACYLAAFALSRRMFTPPVQYLL